MGKSLKKKQIAMLSKFSEAIRTNLTKMQRMKIVALVTIEVHARGSGNLHPQARVLTQPVATRLRNALDTGGNAHVVYYDPSQGALRYATTESAGYELTDLDTFELFPQTSRVETVVRLVRG